MTIEENDRWDTRLLALMATLLATLMAVTWAEDILACVHRRDSQDQVLHKVLDSAVDRGEPQGPDCPPTVETP